ncbi:hypothetical protein PVAND_016023 [Polypedilum vanderplanki]|uniref:BTB domain-containing protein n=1 Tax=Polypedilum vanderplanki TaxID=319348 RepID=A0A9J6BEZ8_POLVA|nr:hypothetical protein PVAND_016023 [Polypedilum vanderplanki]
MANIECEFRYVRDKDDNKELLYECFFDNQKIPFGNFVFERQHLEGMTDKDVTSVEFTNCDFDAFPKHFQKLFPKVTHLCIRNSNLGNISRKHITLWRKMIYISIENCKLKHLKGNLFRDLVDLEYISFAYNEIEDIDPDIFKGLLFLNFVDLRRNKNFNLCFDEDDDDKDACTMDKLTREIFSLHQRKQIQLQENKIKELEQKLQFQENFKELLEQQGRNLMAEMEKKNLEQNEKIKTLEEQIQLQVLKISKLEKDNWRLTKQLDVIMAEPTLKDFTIQIEDRIFNVHKTLFASQSPVIAEMLKNNPDVQELKLKDLKVPIFEVIYEFIIHGKLPGIEADHLENYAAANRLKIDELSKISEKYLLDKINENNTLEILVLSNKFKNDALEQKSFKIIQSKFFPERKLNNELAKQPEKLKKLIEAKMILEKEFREP